MKQPSTALIAELRKEYPKGTRVKLIRMDDPYTKLSPGDKGTVDHVDDMAGIHIRWDKGESLAVIWGEDEIERIKE